MIKDGFNKLDSNLDRIKSLFDESDSKLDELMENMRCTRQRLVGLEHEARQPRLAMEADVKPDTKPCKRADDATADQGKINDSCSVKRVHARPTSSTNFVMPVELLALPGRDDFLVAKGTEVPKPYQGISHPWRYAR